VPLQNRWGTGYLYSESFTSDEKAFDNFQLFLKTKYKKKLVNTSRIIRFKSGYWAEQWIGNSLSIGLSSGFAEPLEATNIHQTVDQITKFVSMYNFKIFEFDKQRYNEYVSSFYDRVYDYIRFCYTGGRTDSEFWKYMTNTVPTRIKYIEEKVSHSLLNSFSFENNIFNYDNFTVVANGLKKIKREMYLEETINRSILEMSKNLYSKAKEEKDRINKLFISHIEYIKKIQCSI
jgi:tryptophan halogenase